MAFPTCCEIFGGKEQIFAVASIFKWFMQNFSPRPWYEKYIEMLLLFGRLLKICEHIYIHILCSPEALPFLFCKCLCYQYLYCYH
jgi:hypothetical protein